MTTIDESATPAGSSTMQVLGQLVALGAVLLPAIGTAVRVVAFEFVPTRCVAAIDIAIAAPLGSLAALGLQAVLPTVLLMAAFQGVLWLRIRGRKRGKKADLTPVPKFAWWTLIIVASVLSFFLVSWPHVLAIIPAFPATYLLVKATENHQLRFARAWIPVVVMAVVLAVVAGLTEVGFQSGRVVLEPGTGLPTSGYSIAGVAADSTYLIPCSKPGNIVSVNTSRINSVIFFRRRTVPQPTLFEMVFRGQPSHAGVQDSCPLVIGATTIPPSSAISSIRRPPR
jgi:hypothetical protein